MRLLVLSHAQVGKKYLLKAILNPNSN